MDINFGGGGEVSGLMNEHLIASYLFHNSISVNGRKIGDVNFQESFWEYITKNGPKIDKIGYKSGTAPDLIINNNNEVINVELKTNIAAEFGSTTLQITKNGVNHDVTIDKGEGVKSTELWNTYTNTTIIPMWIRSVLYDIITEKKDIMREYEEQKKVGQKINNYIGEWIQKERDDYNECFDIELENEKYIWTVKPQYKTINYSDICPVARINTNPVNFIGDYYGLNHEVNLININGYGLYKFPGIKNTKLTAMFDDIPELILKPTFHLRIAYKGHKASLVPQIYVKAAINCPSSKYSLYPYDDKPLPRFLTTSPIEPSYFISYDNWNKYISEKKSKIGSLTGKKEKKKKPVLINSENKIEINNDKLITQYTIIDDRCPFCNKKIKGIIQHIKKQHIPDPVPKERTVKWVKEEKIIPPYVYMNVLLPNNIPVLAV